MTMAKLAIIGGTGLTSLKGLAIIRREVMHTPYGEPSAPLVFGEMAGREVMFLPRHGAGHTIPPHKVNYRANLWALKESGAEKVIAVNAVGGIRADMTPGRLVIPDQIIDYTWSRINTYFEEGLTSVTHIDFTDPYCESLRADMLGCAAEIELDVIAGGTYAATQGPRLETAAEIDRLERDGCDLVGMTGMPEAALARELELCYACVAVVANMGAGRGDGAITMEMIERHLSSGLADVRRLLEQVVPRLA
ncbi:MAG: S-methyl-5'-thioinosine phosphorylase [Gammaproteobacteria bacterium]|nr:S-methyl-5'-thioinosine phosphorylase [Gammaproteobacteria bacterium]